MKKTFKAKTTDVLILTSLYIVTVGLFYLTVTRLYHPVASFDQIRLIMLVLMFPLLVRPAHLADEYDRNRFDGSSCQT